MTATGKDLFGDVLPDRFKSALERYGVWPTTVWDCDMSSPTTRALKEAVGDICSTREGSGSLGYQSRQGSDGKLTESIFNPAVAAWLLNCYAPSEGVCFDPFGGGGTRAIMAAKHGLRYVGCEIRAEECAAVRARCKAAGLNGEAILLQADACAPPLRGNSADFLLTCPPYFNLEQYKGGEYDLSMATNYQKFCQALSGVVRETYRILKPGSNSCWVVGMHRDKSGGLLAIHHHVAAMHIKAGFRFKEEIVLHLKNTGAIQRVGQFEKGDHRLVRVHEYALVFVR